MENNGRPEIPEGDIRSTSMDRLMEVYDQLLTAEDVASKTAILLTLTNYYNYGLTKSNEINGRQGKNRLTITLETSKLMEYSLESDIDEITDKRLTELFISILNTYLSDKQELPTGYPRLLAGMLSRVKALMIMLVSTNQYGIIPYLNIPNYVLAQVKTLFDNIRVIKEEVLDLWIKWLRDNGNPEMADIVQSAGNEFWGSEGIKANVSYDKYFGSIQDKIKNPAETYEKYKEFRLDYRRSTKNILPSKIYDIFDITPDAYHRARLNVYSEISALFPEDENVKTIQKLIFEN